MKFCRFSFCTGGTGAQARHRLESFSLVREGETAASPPDNKQEPKMHRFLTPLQRSTTTLNNTQQGSSSLNNGQQRTTTTTTTTLNNTQQGSSSLNNGQQRTTTTTTATTTTLAEQGPCQCCSLRPTIAKSHIDVPCCSSSWSFWSI
jgi:hypothetical protein